jgi:hypothetical protein
MPLDFRLCQVCTNGEYEEPEYDEEDGTTCRYPSVTCKAAHGAVLLTDDEIPQGCAYVLEQKISTQSMTEEYAKRMSGKGDPDDS